MHPFRRASVLLERSEQKHPSVALVGPERTRALRKHLWWHSWHKKCLFAFVYLGCVKPLEENMSICMRVVLSGLKP